ncbi:hypothetical protein [Phenylobacterium sp.]|uniref:hypothetical protein n=1 Tax=Phenylobacterium sp. TaxID=1871053 RepID=UPI0025D92027|nr:hypothetical protein [Phenylobacterium sp.]
MRTTARALTVGLVSSAALLAANASTAAAAVCPPTTVFNTGLKQLDGYRVFTGPDGDSQVEPLHIEARQVPLLKTGKLLGMIELPNSPKRGAEIVIGPPDVDLPMHAAPYREMFILLGGSVTFQTAKFKAEMKPGSVLLFEDVDAKTGHGGRTGPCGYISLSIAP